MTAMAHTAEQEGVCDGWGDVIAVIVMHENGIRQTVWSDALVRLDPSKLEHHIASIDALCRQARMDGLS